VETALYIALGLLVTVAVAMQVWQLRTGLKAGAGGGAALLRILNLALIVGVVLLVIYVLAGK
jgi:hypothetical protein